MKKVVFCTLAAAMLAFTISAQNKSKDKKKDDKKWDVNNPPGKYTETEFTVTEGTWMNLDVSPDGKEIVFDLLGDIYSIPLAGGEAKILRSGLAFEVQPRFSPDGTRISFTSDAGGGDNIWSMKRDGSDAKQITKESFRLLNNAVWTVDGNYLITRKHFTSGRSLGAGELWMYHKSGGDGIQLTKRKNDQQDLGEPSVSADGKYVYYSEDMYPGGYFQYNKDPNSQIYVVKRYDFEKGEIEDITGGNGSAFRPQISKDGKTLAFVKRVQAKTVLYLRNMETGEEWPVFDKLSKDQTEAWAIFGVYSNFAWLDASHIIIWAQGKLWNVDITNSNAVNIPFTAKCKHKLHETLKFKQDVAPDKFTVKTIRHAITSPDEKYIVFSALGKLWKKNLPDGKPEALTGGFDFCSEPSFSPDGKELVFVIWSDENSGSVAKLDLDKKMSIILTDEKGIFRTPSFSSDGKNIVVWKEDGNDAQGFAFCTNPGLYWLSSGGGKINLITKEGGWMLWPP
ncbi:MAG: PD40 domain-containing protein, partial [Bacteroidia bacterium]|nr:PD40 domain-containing protein [Bacteroidia bacterium]